MKGAQASKLCKEAEAWRLEEESGSHYSKLARLLSEFCEPKENRFVFLDKSLGDVYYSFCG